jgi:hypothetical protein
MTFASTIKSIRLSFDIRWKFSTALRIIWLDADPATFERFFDIIDPQIGWMVQPGSQDAGWIPDGELDIPVEDPKGRGQPRPVVADHRPVIVVEASQSGNLEAGETAPTRPIATAGPGLRNPGRVIGAAHPSDGSAQRTGA